MARVLRQQNPNPTRASPRTVKLLGSGTVVAVGTIAMPAAAASPMISEAFTVAPEVVYSPTPLAVALALATKIVSAPAALVSSQAGHVIRAAR